MWAVVEMQAGEVGGRVRGCLSTSGLSKVVIMDLKLFLSFSAHACCSDLVGDVGVFFLPGWLLLCQPASPSSHHVSDTGVPPGLFFPRISRQSRGETQVYCPPPLRWVGSPALPWEAGAPCCAAQVSRLTSWGPRLPVVDPLVSSILSSPFCSPCLSDVKAAGDTFRHVVSSGLCTCCGGSATF